jgi:hypothetical protein
MYSKYVRRGQVFSVANQSPVAITAGLATTYTGLVVGNKVNSLRDLVMVDCSYSTNVAIPTATALGLMVGTHTTDVANSLTIKNRYIGNTEVSNAWSEDSCTLPGTPVLCMPFATAWTEAVTAGTLSQPNIVPIKGKIVLKPGSFIAFYSSALNTASFLFSFTWIETPVDDFS